jgi:hypothetical protein
VPVRLTERFCKALEGHVSYEERNTLLSENSRRPVKRTLGRTANSCYQNEVNPHYFLWLRVMSPKRISLIQSKHAFDFFEIPNALRMTGGDVEGDCE